RAPGSSAAAAGWRRSWFKPPHCPAWEGARVHARAVPQARPNCAIIPVPPGSLTPATFSRFCPSCADLRPQSVALPLQPRPRMSPATPPQDIAVRLSDVRLDRGTRTVLSGIDLDVPRGSITAVLGPSGSGKSTLLAALT